MYSPVMAVIKSLDGTEEYEREGIISGKITHGCMGSTFCIGNSFSHMLELEAEYSPMYVKGMTFRFDLIENYATSHELLYKHNFIIESAKRNLDRVSITAYGVFNVPAMNSLFNWEWCKSSETGEIPSFGEVLQAISDHIGVVFQGTAGENLCETLAGVKLPYRNCSIGYENDGSKYTIRQMIEYVAGAFGCNATEMESIDGSGISGIILGNYIGIPFPGKYGAFTFDKEVYSDGNQGYYSLDGSILGDNDFFDRIEVRTTSGDSINRSTDVISERTISMGSSEQEARYTLQLENPFIDSARLNYVFSLLTSFENTGGRFFAHSGSLKYAGNIMLDDYDSVMCEVGGSITCGPVMQVVTTFDGGLSHEVTITGPESIQSSSGSGGSSVIVGGNGTMNQVIVQINKNNEANQQFHNVTTEKLIVMGEAIAKSITTDNLSAKVAEIDSLEADSAIIQNIFSESIISDKAILDVLQAKVVDANVVKAAVAEVGYLTADEANLVYATINSLEAEKARISVLEADNATINGKLSVIEVEVEGKLNANDLSAEVAKLGYATADNLNATNAKIEDLDVNKLSVADAKVQYAEIDLSNVGTQVVSTSMIKDGAVTNEKVGNLSANKIISGTIDASKINVTNLNADNLTVGTINGKLIGNGSVDLDKLSQEVPTKEYLDNVQKELQGQIDGAIETFTKSEIPTLNNEPANAWTDNETRKKHIGDVCYVLNPASSADGYCYRFANTGTESSPSYEWVLIKDSDVTKALQDIIDINGEITGIKQFDTEISSWKNDTDAELSSLKSRTTTLETDIGSKVESSVFNELKQTVDENSSSITSLSTTVSKKADGSTVEELTNTVNSVKQTADKNTLSISGMQTEIGKKADGSTVTELSKKTSELEQSLNGFKTTVSNTYATKTALNSVQTIAEQTADKFSWLVKSGTSATDFTLTDRVASLLSEQFDIDALTTFKNSAENGTSTVINGGAIKAKTIKAESIDVDSIFSQNISAKGTITGGSFVGSSFEGATGSFAGEITATSGRIGFMNVTSTDISLDKGNKYGEFTLSRDKYIKMSEYDDNAAGYASYLSKSSFAMSKYTLKPGSMGSYRQYGSDLTPSEFAMKTFNTTGSVKDKTSIKATGIDTPDVTVNSLSTKTAILKSLRAYELTIGNITINSGSPFSMSIASVLLSLEGNLVGACLKKCWPASTWAFSNTLLLNGTDLYIATTTTQTYNVSVVIFYTIG